MTRYPKAGKGNKWTVKELSSIAKDWKGNTLSDGDGLSGEVRINAAGDISIPFRYCFKWLGKVCWYYCGAYPSTELTKIREERDKARIAIKRGVDPRAKKIADKITSQAEVNDTIVKAEKDRNDNLTVQDLFDVWVKDGVSRSDGNKYIILTFRKYVLNVLGDVGVRDLTEHDLRALYRSIIADGKIATAVEHSKDIGQMLRWAERRKPWRALLVDGNPAELVEVNKLLPIDYTKERKRLLSIDEIKKLKNIFDSTEQLYLDALAKHDAERPLKKEVQLAVWICLSTICRIGELMMAEWKHVNFKERTWYIPAANTKGTRGNKNDQLVYLSDFSINQFNKLHALTGSSPWLFPARLKDGFVCVKSASKLIGDRQIKFKSRNKKLQCRVENNSLVIGDVEWTPHDLRRTGATMMQKLKINRDVINLCQNHVIGSKTDRVYLLDDYADDKREAWILLGGELQSILGEF